MKAPNTADAEKALDHRLRVSGCGETPRGGVGLFSPSHDGDLGGVRVAFGGVSSNGPICDISRWGPGLRGEDPGLRNLAPHRQS